MAKIEIPEGLKGKELTVFLLENKSALIAQKKSIIKTTDTVTVHPTVYGKSNGATKAEGAPPASATSVLVKVVANACNFCDSQLDVLLPNSAKRSISERRNIIPHLHDHIHMLDAKVGDVEDIYLADIPLRDLGLDKSGTTQCIIFETLIQKSYNPFIFEQYKSGAVNQHSIGLQYVRMDIAINDPESEKEFDFWNKHYPDVINKDMVDEYGFFFVVQEIKLLENSCVLFGANSLTPTLETGKSHSTAPAEKALQEEPAFDTIKAIRELKFIN